MDHQQRSARIAICAAMRWELRPVLRALPGVRLLRSTQPRTWLAAGREGPVLIFQTGVGSDAAAAAMKSILADFSLDAIINTGCAGSLSPLLSAGAVVCGTAFLAEEAAQIRKFPTSPRLTSALSRAAAAVGLQPFTDTILTSPVALMTAEAKAAAFSRCGAVAVEMEGAALARLVADLPLEVASVRVILDDVTTALPTLRAPSKTTFDFAQKVARAIVSAEELKRFSITAKNALIVDRVLENLFKSFFSSNV